MKKLFTFLLITLLTSFTLSAQDQFAGQWGGTLEFSGVKLRIIFNVSQSDKGYSSTMDSPDQGVKDLPITTTTLENSNVTFDISMAGIEYTGILKDNMIEGNFNQGGMSLKLDLSKNTTGESFVKRPQEPKEPFPYLSENITFKNTKANITLAGTLTLPSNKGNFPVVVLINGSGAHDRNSELMEHKPFLVISDYLTRNGIAVLRFDERGVGESGGTYEGSTTEDLAQDIQSAVEYLKTRKEIDKKKIGLIGHSEGGVIAPMVAASNPKDINFIVLLAGSGLRGDQLLLLQQKLVLGKSGAPEAFIQANFEKHTKIFDKIINNQNNNELRTALISIISDYTSDTDIPGGMTKQEFLDYSASAYTDSWMNYFIKFDPSTVLEKVKCPVLAVNGDKDLQVPSTENLAAIKNALNKGGNKNVTIKEYPNLNHLFQESETGLPQEYSVIEQTFSPTVLKDVTAWIKNQTK